jgi:hypothetical protein
MLKFKYKEEDPCFRQMSKEDIELGNLLLNKLNEKYKVIMTPSPTFRVHNNGELDTDDFVGWTTITKQVTSYKLPEINEIMTLDVIISDIIAELGNAKLLYVLEYGFYIIEVKLVENEIKRYITIRLTV